MKLIRVLLKTAGAILFLLILIGISTYVAWEILSQAPPDQTIVYLVILSAISGVMIAGLTIYRLVTTLRSATLTLICTLPMLTTLMAGIITYWFFIRLAIKAELPEAMPLIEFISRCVNSIDKCF